MADTTDAASHLRQGLRDRLSLVRFPRGGCRDVRHRPEPVPHHQRSEIIRKRSRMTQPTLKTVKAQAKALQQALETSGTSVSHAQSLELIA